MTSSVFMKSGKRRHRKNALTIVKENEKHNHRGSVKYMFEIVDIQY